MSDNTLPGEPYYMAIFARAKDGGSMLRRGHFDELKDYYNYIFNEMNITHGNKTYRYNQLCGIFCDFNAALWKLMVSVFEYGPLAIITIRPLTVGQNCHLTIDRIIIRLFTTGHYYQCPQTIGRYTRADLNWPERLSKERYISCVTAKHGPTVLA